jgi:hypothetical protein
MVSENQGRLAVIAAILIAAVILVEGSALFPPVPDWPDALLAALGRIPLWAFLLAFTVLPALGFPILAFYATVGAFADGIGQALLISWICMAGNMALSYLIADRFSAPLSRLAKRGGYRIPRIDPADGWKVVIVMRASPLPWLLQSWLLTLGGVRFVPYMVLGVPVQAMVGLGYIILGESVLAGNAKWALIGLFLAMAGYLVLSILRRRGSAAKQLPDTDTLKSV